MLFALVRRCPATPRGHCWGSAPAQTAIARVNAAYGFDQPLFMQYLTYVKALLHGDFGSSIQTGRPVMDSFLERFPATIELGLAALLLAVVVGVPLGYLAARHQGRVLDTAVVSGSLLGVVTPVFFLAILLKLVFADTLHWLPTALRQNPRIDATHITNFYVLDGLMTREWDAAWDAVVHLVLPAIALGTIPLAIIVRITRASVAEVMHEDYVRTAESKGLASAVISRRHILRNALLPVVTTIGLQAGLLFSGAVLTETVFSFNGIGQNLFDAIGHRDYPVLQGFILFIAIVYSLINLLVDLAYGVIDPRVRAREPVAAPAGGGVDAGQAVDAEVHGGQPVARRAAPAAPQPHRHRRALIVLRVRGHGRRRTAADVVPARLGAVVGPGDADLGARALGGPLARARPVRLATCGPRWSTAPGSRWCTAWSRPRSA